MAVQAVLQAINNGPHTKHAPAGNTMYKPITYTPITYKPYIMCGCA